MLLHVRVLNSTDEEQHIDPKHTAANSRSVNQLDGVDYLVTELASAEEQPLIQLSLNGETRLSDPTNVTVLLDHSNTPGHHVMIATTRFTARATVPLPRLKVPSIFSVSSAQQQGRQVRPHRALRRAPTHSESQPSAWSNVLQIHASTSPPSTQESIVS